jgi:hypothetical protein
MLGWAERLVRGLYAHETGSPVPDGLRVTPGFGEDHREVMSQVIAWLASRPLRTVGEFVVEYKWMPMSDRPEASGWCIELYRCMPIIGFVIPAGETG